MSEERMKILEDRLLRLEATLAQRPAGTFGSPGGAVVDPAPWGGGGYGYPPRPWGPRWPPYVDPAPWPPYITDPAPWPPFVSDPAPHHGNVFTQPTSASTFSRFGAVVDPVPPDFSRLSIAQLESSLHSINAEKARLESMEAMIRKQIERTTKAQAD
jgi:hypothetical protein